MPEDLLDNFNLECFVEGVEAYRRYEGRDAMYRIALFLVEKFWGHPGELADSLGVLLLTWNQAFYRYGTLDLDKLEQFLRTSSKILNEFRKADILGSSHLENPQGEGRIKEIFEELLDVLGIKTKNGEKKKSPVSVAKTLHLIAPNLFPLWDERISKKYNCWYYKDPSNAYLKFMKKMKVLSEKIDQEGYIEVLIDRIGRDHLTWRIEDREFHKSILKLLDEYNYARYTKKWISCADFQKTY